MRAFVHSSPSGKATISANQLGWLLKQVRLVELLGNSERELRWLWNYELKELRKQKQALDRQWAFSTGLELLLDREKAEVKRLKAELLSVGHH